MSITLGIDTGGTYTDAVLMRDETKVVATAKSLTTRSDLAIGIEKAVRGVLNQAQVSPNEISLASLSTTLATNALVEGHGGRVGLVYIGFDARDLDSHGLKDALNGDPVITLAGGHDYSGTETEPLDYQNLQKWLSHGLGVSAFAVASQFATRNPAHEQRAVEIIGEITGKPISASHQLSSKLNGPKRALTALLNARLIGLTHKLIGRAENILTEIGITAPLMVVRGDGALISSEMAKERPIETILSGPAASIVGAHWMTGLDDALVSDIGGTTTDIALLRNGKPEIDVSGARVGSYRTMVEAVAMRTTGLGGDSEVHAVDHGFIGSVNLGPRRVLPISLIAYQEPNIVLPALEKQLRAASPGEYDCQFVRKVQGTDTEGLSKRDQLVFQRIKETAQPLDQVLKTRVEALSIQRLISRGVIQVSGVTPSDASHVLGLLNTWHGDAAATALEIFGRRRTGAGNVLATDPRDMARIIVDQLTSQTSLALLAAAFHEEVEPYSGIPENLAQNEMLQRGLERRTGLIKFEASLDIAVIGLGASAATYYPAVGDRLHCQVTTPMHAGVANAIGAIVGRVKIRKSGIITSPSEGIYRVHFPEGPKDFNLEGEAIKSLEDQLGTLALAEAAAGGTENAHLTVHRDIKRANVEERDVFIEATILVEASGRPPTSH